MIIQRVDFLADFLSDLPQVFRERYLQTHSIYLKSIADIIQVTYFTKGQIKKAANFIIYVPALK